MMALQRIILNGVELGSREIPNWTDLANPKIAYSYALFCPICGEIWGRLKHDHPSAYTQCITSMCRAHAEQPSHATFTSQCPWPGDPRGVDDVTQWPLPVLQHDVASMCDYFLNHPDKSYLL